MTDENFGASLFSKEEIDQSLADGIRRKEEYAKKLEAGFFRDGLTRKITINGIDKEERTSQKGNKYVLHTYYLADLDSGETEKLVDFNFAFTNAFEPVKTEHGTTLRAGVTSYRLVISKSGERENAGVSYPVWGFEISLLDNPAAPKAPAGEPFSTTPAPKPTDGPDF